MTSSPTSLVHLIPQTNQLKVLMTKIRNKATPMDEFLFYSDRVIRLLVEEGLAFLPVQEQEVMTPTGVAYKGYDFAGNICGVSIIRAGESMEKALREVCKQIRIGKILIQRCEETAQPKLFYTKLPEDIAHRHVLLLDPMLATGGSAVTAVGELIKVGVKEENIIFLNLVAAPEGIRCFHSHHPAVQIVTAQIDDALNENKYIIPGLGDFGDRYFGTK